MSVDLLGIGASGLRAARAALEVAGDNVANASTPGYARRATVQAAGQAGAAMTPLSRSFSGGVGVDLSGVRRISDDFRNAEARSATADAERFRALQAWLEPVQAALPTGDASIGAGIGELLDAGSAVAADPTALAPRTKFLAAADSLAQRFRAATDKLAEQQKGVTDAIGTACARVTSLARSLAALNDEARRASPGTAEAATIADRRDALLDELHGLVAIRTSLAPDGSTEIRCASGTALVSGGHSAIVVARNGAGGVQIVSDPYGSHAATQSVGSGTLAGLLDAARNGADASDALDQLATAVATAFNAAHQAGSDLDGDSGAPLFSGPAELTALITDPRKVAAAAPPASEGNDAMLALIGLRDANFAERYDAQVTQVATALATAQESSTAANSTRDAAIAARDAISGVNLDDEASDILRFQQAYQAAARVLSTARTMFDTLFDLR